MKLYKLMGKSVKDNELKDYNYSTNTFVKGKDVPDSEDKLRFKVGDKVIDKYFKSSIFTIIKVATTHTRTLYINVDGYKFSVNPVNYVKVIPNNKLNRILYPDYIEHNEQYLKENK